jgi:hypothetical protein
VRNTAATPNHPEHSEKLLLNEFKTAAWIATTMMTLDIAFVTDMRGACKAGVTFNTT